MRIVQHFDSSKDGKSLEKDDNQEKYAEISPQVDEQVPKQVEQCCCLCLQNGPIVAQAQVEFLKVHLRSETASIPLSIDIPANADQFNTMVCLVCFDKNKVAASEAKSMVKEAVNEKQIVAENFENVEPVIILPAVEINVAPSAEEFEMSPAQVILSKRNTPARVNNARSRFVATPSQMSSVSVKLDIQVEEPAIVGQDSIQVEEPTALENDDMNVDSPIAPTPKVATPRVNTPKVNTPKVATPKVNTPKVATPKVNTPKVATPKVATPMPEIKAATPKPATPIPEMKVSTPKVATPILKTATPKVSTPMPEATETIVGEDESVEVDAPTVAPIKVATPKPETPRRITTPRAASSRAATPNVAIPQEETVKVATPKVATPKVATPKVATPKVAAEEESVKVATPKPATPKVGTPKVEATENVVDLNSPFQASGSIKRPYPKSFTPLLVNTAIRNSPVRSGLASKLVDPSPRKRPLLDTLMSPVIKRVKSEIVASFEQKIDEIQTSTVPGSPEEFRKSHFGDALPRE